MPKQSNDPEEDAWLLNDYLRNTFCPLIGGSCKPTCVLFKETRKNYSCELKEALHATSRNKK